MPPSFFTAEEESALRREAMAWLTLQSHNQTTPLSTSQIEGFLFRGRPYRLMDRQLGIRKPRELAGALTIRTVFPRPGRPRPYEDFSSADGFLHYKWQGTDAETYTNRGLRTARRLQLPLIYFFGVGEALWLPIFPIYVVDELPTEHAFLLRPDDPLPIAVDSPVEEVVRRYLEVRVHQRVHQPVFRSMVMTAYRTTCCVCELRHASLLDAAHIVPDRHEHGIAAVKNGLSLCKIHHAAYDSNILGISPDLRVAIRADVLDEVDGPLLEHGLKGLHDQRLRVLPSAPRDRPDPELLDLRFREFLSL